MVFGVSLSYTWCNIKIGAFNSYCILPPSVSSTFHVLYYSSFRFFRFIIRTALSIFVYLLWYLVHFYSEWYKWYDFEHICTKCFPLHMIYFGSIYRNHCWLRLRKWLLFNILHLFSSKSLLCSLASLLFCKSFLSTTCFFCGSYKGFSYPTCSIALYALFLTIVDLISRFSSLFDAVLFL